MSLTPTRIRMHIAEAGLTQVGLASKLGVSQAAISLTIKGERRTGPASTVIRRAICTLIKKPYRVVWGVDEPAPAPAQDPPNDVKNFTPVPSDEPTSDAPIVAPETP